MIDAKKLAAAERDALVAALGEVLGRRAGEDSGERGAALRAYDREIATAWQEADPEFGNALNLALALHETGPLVDYMEHHPLTVEQGRTLATWIGQLVAKVSGKSPGRPRGRASSKMAKAERNAAAVLDMMRAAWRAEQGLKRVPDRVTKEMLDEAIRLVAANFGIAKDEISEETVRDLLKTGRVKLGRRT
jgi:hypothetical protein